MHKRVLTIWFHFYVILELIWGCFWGTEINLVGWFKLETFWILIEAVIHRCMCLSKLIKLYTEDLCISLHANTAQ